MSRPPPIPSDNVSPRRASSTHNGAFRERALSPPSQQRRNDGSPQPRLQRRVDSYPSSQGSPNPGSPGAPLYGSSLPPNRGDMEALLRQWTSSSSRALGGTNDRGLPDGMDELRIDRSASFDDEPRGSPRRGVSAHLAGDVMVLDDDLRDRHRRIASTGGNRLPIDLGVPQMFDVGDSLLDGLEGDSELIINGHANASALHDAARITDWPSVAALSETNPESARYVGPDGWNALHHACDRRCPHVDVMDALLTAYPEALVQTNDKGWTPLHRACRNKTPRDVVKLLLRKYPELGKRAAAMRCNDGRSSLHYALLYDAPEGVVDLLLQADPNAVLDEDRDGVSPLGTVWDKYANTFDGRRTLQILLRPFEGEGWELGTAAGSDTVAEERKEGDSVARPPSDKEVAEGRVREAMKRDVPSCKALQLNWKKANTLLRAYFRFPLQEEKSSAGDGEDDKPTRLPSGSSSSEMNVLSTGSRKRKWRVLHATSAIKCHQKLFLLARALHPEQALETDENDLYPSCSRSSSVGGDISSSSRSMQDPQSLPLSKKTALHFAATSQLSGREGRTVIKVLLKLNPNAAQDVDGHGSLPLHLICQNARKLQHWTILGIKDVFDAHRQGASCKDGMGRTPLHCVASTAGQYAHSPLPASSPPGDGNAHTVAGGTAVGGAPGGVAQAALQQSVIVNLVNADQTAAATADNTGRLPLHYIAERTEEWSSDAAAILDVHPAAASTRAGPSTSNQLPLHMAACSPDARPSLIMNLVQANPRAASLMDGAGRLPLHLAVDSGRTTWDRGINSIYEAYTRAISVREDGSSKWTVLHAAAASHCAGKELIEKIISLNTDAASIADGEGRHPLHLACASNRSWEEGVKVIFDADPSAALSEDKEGMLPFHNAAMSCCSPLSGSLENEMGDDAGSEVFESPAAREDADADDLESLEVLFNLLIAQPSVVQP